MRKAIVKVITVIAILAFIACAMLLDSDSMIPSSVCFISGAWLLAFVISNADYLQKEAE